MDKELVKPGVEMIVFGKPAIFNNKITITHPEMEAVSRETPVQPGLQAVYHSSEKAKTAGFGSKGFQKPYAPSLKFTAGLFWKPCRHT